jgi:hypothetical protein
MILFFQEQHEIEIFAFVDRAIFRMGTNPNKYIWHAYINEKIKRKLLLPPYGFWGVPYEMTKIPLLVA